MKTLTVTMTLTDDNPGDGDKAARRIVEFERDVPQAGCAAFIGGVSDTIASTLADDFKITDPE